jgi:hypothetical protein
MGGLWVFFAIWGCLLLASIDGRLKRLAIALERLAALAERARR